MGLVNFRHRYFIRQYIYPILCLLFIILLVRWNTSNRTQINGRQGHENELWERIAPSKQSQLPQQPLKSSIRMPTEPVERLLTEGLKNNEVGVEKQLIDGAVELRPPMSSTKTLGNTVSIVVYMEAQCPDTTGFIRRNLVPTWKKLGYLNRLNVTIVPFGKATCTPAGDDFTCECQHGPSECELNSLMNCVIENKIHARDYIPLIGCIQGQDDLSTAAQQCLTSENKDWLVQCASSKRGRYLLAMAGERTAALGSQFDFVPWVVLNGERDIDSFYALEDNVCKKLQPQPVECQSEKHNQVQNVV